MNFALQALSSDVMLHQADLRFISLAVQKYIEEAKVRDFSSKISCNTWTYLVFY